jgi:hypothetical protein
MYITDLSEKYHCLLNYRGGRAGNFYKDPNEAVCQGIALAEKQVAVIQEVIDIAKKIIETG